jgi:hypothetical protein
MEEALSSTPSTTKKGKTNKQTNKHNGQDQKFGTAALGLKLLYLSVL